MRTQYTSARTTALVTLAVALDHLRVDAGTPAEAEVALQVDASTDWVESLTGMTWTPRTVETVGVPDAPEVYLPRGPVSAVTAVDIADDAGVYAPITGYVWRPGESRVTLPADALTGATVRVRYSAAPVYVPASITSAVLLHAQAHYDKTAKDMPTLLDAAMRLAHWQRQTLGV